MPKEEWGVKRACPKCTVRFYDLQQDPMTCPSCGATFDVASLTQQKSRSAAPVKEVKELTPAPADTEETDADVLDDEDDSNAEDLGDDLLEEDDGDTVNLEEIADMPSDQNES